MLSFDIGQSALRTAQQATDVIGQNLANASNPNYHRQVADLVSTSPVGIGNLLFGTGVDVAGINQLRNSLVEAAITRNKSDLGSTKSQLDTLSQLQTTLGSGDGSLGNRIEDFFNQLQQLASQPENTTLRRVVFGSATTLTGQFNSLATSLDSSRSALDAEARDVVTTINGDTKQIAQLNGQIQDATVRGLQPNDLRDQRDQLVNDLASHVAVQVVTQNNGQVSVVAGGAALVVGSESVALDFAISTSNQAIVTPPGSTSPLAFSGGDLGGLLAVRNQTLPDYHARLDALAGQLARQVDGIQATGLGLSGPSTFLSSQRSVRNITVPLTLAGLAFPPTSGTLFVSVTNLASGNRTLTALSIDPATNNLQDVANALGTVPNLQAVTNSTTGTLQILASPGYAFDFGGRPPTNLSAGGITGTTRPAVTGSFTGTTNDVYTFQVVGSGTVGVSQGLSLQVKNSSGASIANLAIGQGYSPGSKLTLPNGLSVQLAAGTANNGDTFSLPVISQPDTGGLLTSLGLGTFFQGSSAADISVRNDLTSDPTRLAGSRTGEPGDASNLDRLVALRDQATLAGGSQTFRQFYASIIGDVGSQVSNLGNLQTSQAALEQQLTKQQQSVSGVDPNEELTHLLNSQHAFETASKYISVVNSTLDSLLNIL